MIAYINTKLPKAEILEPKEDIALKSIYASG